LIVPPTNTVNESEWRLAIPNDVSFHTHRMAIHTDIVSPEGRAALDADLDAAFSMVLPVRPDVIAYACTAGSMVVPVNSLPDALSKKHGVAAVTTSAAIIAAFGALSVKRPAVITPYTQGINDLEASFLQQNGFEVAGISGRGIGPDNFTKIAQTPIQTVLEQVLETVTDRSDAITILCTDLPSLGLIRKLEEQTGLPVITSNQATLWACLRAAGLDDHPPILGQLAAH
jgi:maleate isomerase/arylmalonate decarboxylase